MALIGKVRKKATRIISMPPIPTSPSVFAPKWFGKDLLKYEDRRRVGDPELHGYDVIAEGMGRPGKKDTSRIKPKGSRN